MRYDRTTPIRAGIPSAVERYHERSVSASPGVSSEWKVEDEMGMVVAGRLRRLRGAVARSG